MGTETPISQMTGSPAPDSGRDPYRGVVLLLLTLVLLATIAAEVAALLLSNAMLFDVGLTLGLSAAILVGVGYAQTVRATPLEEEAPPENATKPPPETPTPPVE